VRYSKKESKNVEIDEKGNRKGKKLKESEYGERCSIYCCGKEIARSKGENLSFDNKKES